MKAPSQYIKQLLIDEMISAADGQPWMTFVQHMMDAPDNCFAVNDVGGRKQGRLQKTGEVIYRPAVIITIRAKTFELGWAKGQDILAVVDAIRDQSVTVISSEGNETGIIKSITRPDTVNPIGSSDGTTKRREEFTLMLWPLIQAQVTP